MGAIGWVALLAAGLVLNVGYDTARDNTSELVRDKSDVVVHGITERIESQFAPVGAQDP